MGRIRALVFLLGMLGLSFYLGYTFEDTFLSDGEAIGLYSNEEFCKYEGHWVHIKVEEDMDFKRIVTTCNHESGHYLFCKLNNFSDKDCMTKYSENYANVCKYNPKLCLNDE